MEHENFERELPEGYELVKHLNAKKVSFGVIMNVVALVVLVAVAIVNLAVLIFTVKGNADVHVFSYGALTNGFLIGLVLTFVYIVLHELVHGYAYKKKTGEKLTFGMSWSCAFCGVPNIYVYRKPALFAALAPFVFFGGLFLLLTLLALAVIAFTDSPEVMNVFCSAYVALTLLQGFHIGGCSGDIYIYLLLARRFSDDRALVKDTGPEQFIYLPKKSASSEE